MRVGETFLMSAYFVRELLVLPVILGSIFAMLSVWATWRVLARRGEAEQRFAPPLTVLKPLHGLEPGLADNIASFCRQDYPQYQLVLSVQHSNDPAIPLMRRFERDYPHLITVVIKDRPPTLNGKVQNLIDAVPAARHDYLVISDSDVRASRDYLTKIVQPLADSSVGYACTLYRAVDATRWYDKLELLGMNLDFVPGVVFAYWSKAAPFCLGATVAFRRDDLEAIGGMAALADYLVEDQELGRRITATGKSMSLVPMTVDLIARFDSFRNWWTHQVYWDQNTKAANPMGFALTVLVRAVPFALLYVLATGASATSLAVLAAAVAIRCTTAAAIARLLDDREGLRALWLLPLRDVLGLGSWLAAMVKRRFFWRGHEFELTASGRIILRDETTDIAAVKDA